MESHLGWREALGFGPDPYTVSSDRWIGSLPAHVDWMRLEDRLIARGWYPKNAVANLRVYGCDGGHEVVIELAGRRVIIRIHGSVRAESRPSIAEQLGRTLAEEAAHSPIGAPQAPIRAPHAA
ncbi:hypothetical protein [Sandaracinus amylolyticus]|nr:hypothetical protein [Sandaracinus amylolyticus]